MIIWYRLFSVAVLVVWACLAGAIMLYSPFNGFRGVVVFTNGFHEGYLEAVITLLALPGWWLLLKDEILRLRGLRA